MREKMVKIKDRWGTTHYVNGDDLRPDRKRYALYTKSGIKYGHLPADYKIRQNGTMICRENIVELAGFDVKVPIKT